MGAIMKTQNVTSTFTRLLNQPVVPSASEDIASCVFAVGVLIGAELPGSAATVARLLDYKYPNTHWPWSTWKEEA